jgi:PAS domain-containing protein
MARRSYRELEQRIRELEAQAEERKSFEEKERCEKETAQEYLDIAGVAIVAMNARGEVTLINKKGCDILGYPEERGAGQGLVRSLPS